jgi:hypothetical protein
LGRKGGGERRGETEGHHRNRAPDGSHGVFAASCMPAGIATRMAGQNGD